MSEVKGAPARPPRSPRPAPAKLAARSPVDQIRAVRADQDRLVDAAETFAKTRADRLRLAFRLAGLDRNPTPAAASAAKAWAGR